MALIDLAELVMNDLGQGLWFRVATDLRRDGMTVETAIQRDVEASGRARRSHTA